MDVCLECVCVCCAGCSLCDELITLSEESYRLCVCVCVCVCVCCAGCSLCDELITLSEESYRLCVCV